LINGEEKPRYVASSTQKVEKEEVLPIKDVKESKPEKKEECRHKKISKEVKKEEKSFWVDLDPEYTLGIFSGLNYLSFIQDKTLGSFTLTTLNTGNFGVNFRVKIEDFDARIDYETVDVNYTLAGEKLTGTVKNFNLNAFKGLWGGGIRYSEYPLLKVAATSANLANQSTIWVNINRRFTNERKKLRDTPSGYNTLVGFGYPVRAGSSNSSIKFSGLWGYSFYFQGEMYKKYLNNFLSFGPGINAVYQYEAFDIDWGSAQGEVEKTLLNISLFLSLKINL
jgi:hypothetical protein